MYINLRTLKLWFRKTLVKIRKTFSILNFWFWYTEYMLLLHGDKLGEPDLTEFNRVLIFKENKLK